MKQAFVEQIATPNSTRRDQQSPSPRSRMPCERSVRFAGTLLLLSVQKGSTTKRIICRADLYPMLCTIGKHEYMSGDVLSLAEFRLPGLGLACLFILAVQLYT